MKKLAFVVAILFAASPAYSVDYVQCEAARRRLGVLKWDKIDAMNKFRRTFPERESTQRLKKETCGIWTKDLPYSAKVAWANCVNEIQRRVESPYVERMATQDPFVQSIDHSMSRIRQDMNSMGCQ